MRWYSNCNLEFTNSSCDQSAPHTCIATFTVPVGSTPILCNNNGPLTCTNTSVQLTANNCTGTGVNYLWTGPSGFTATTQQCPTTSIQGTYKVVVTNLTGGCPDSCTTMVGSNTTPPNANAGADASIACGASTLQLQGSTTTVGATYSWTAGGGGNIVSGGNTLTPIVNAAGTYTLTVTASKWMYSY